jgi:hypothetical protein
MKNFLWLLWNWWQKRRKNKNMAEEATGEVKATVHIKVINADGTVRNEFDAPAVISEEK